MTALKLRDEKMRRIGKTFLRSSAGFVEMLVKRAVQNVEHLIADCYNEATLDFESRTYP